MANKNGHGGYRRPANPASVSGPGSLSRRTDGRQPVMNMPSQSYGDGTDLQNLQSSAPMFQAGGPAPGGAAGGGAPGPQLPTPLSAPSAMPDVPVTAGAAAGPGPGLSALNLPPQTNGLDLQQLRAVYGPVMPALLAEAQSKYATQDFRDRVAALYALM